MGDLRMVFVNGVPVIEFVAPSKPLSKSSSLAPSFIF